MTETHTAPAGTSETTEAHGGAGEGGHGGTFPPLDTTTYPSQLLWLVIFFGALYYLSAKIVLPRIGAILNHRSGVIDGDLAQAKALQEQTQAAVQSYQKALAEARAKAQTIAQDTRKNLQTEIDAERNRLESDLQAKLTTAEAQIAESRNKALADVSTVAAETAQAIVEQLTGTKVPLSAATKAVSGKA